MILFGKHGYVNEDVKAPRERVSLQFSGVDVCGMMEQYFLIAFTQNIVGFGPLLSL